MKSIPHNACQLTEIIIFNNWSISCGKSSVVMQNVNNRRNWAKI